MLFDFGSKWPQFCPPLQCWSIMWEQPRFGGFAFDCHKVGAEQKNIFFPFYAALACNIKDIDYRFLPHGKQILHSLERPFESTDLGPVSFEFDSTIALEILIHHEDSPSWKNGSLCARLFEVWLQILWDLHQALPTSVFKSTAQLRK